MQFFTCIKLKAHSQVQDSFWELKTPENDKKCFLSHLKGSVRSQDI